MAKKNAAKEQPNDEELRSVEAQPEGDEQTPDPAPDVLVENLQKELDAAKEAHIRTLAEYDNYRKRSTREKEASYGDAKAAVLTQLLGVLDNFERALSAQDADTETLRKGLEMIYDGFCQTLEKLGVEAFGEAGETFDPNIHNAVMHLEDDTHGENEIAAVFSKGYRLGERILRPAMVQVAN